MASADSKRSSFSVSLKSYASRRFGCSMCYTSIWSTIIGIKGRMLVSKHFFSLRVHCVRPCPPIGALLLSLLYLLYVSLLVCKCMRLAHGRCLQAFFECLQLLVALPLPCILDVPGMFTFMHIFFLYYYYLHSHFVCVCVCVCVRVKKKK